MVNAKRRLAITKFCSVLCRARGQPSEVHAKKVHRGQDHPRFVPVGTRRQWAGRPGVSVKTDQGWEREHRVVVGAPNRSKQEQYAVVHHIDGDPTNNTPENLQVMTQAQHALLHDPERVRDRKGRYT
jgi:hypothetical protein